LTTGRTLPARLNRCEFRDGERRCQSRENLQFDHIVPFAMGGSNTVENLQLLCPAHNRIKAIQDFGERKMRKYLNKM